MKAAESSKKAAIELCKKDNKENNIFLHKKEKFMLTKPIREIDNLLYILGVDYIIIIIAVIFLLLILYRF